MIPERSLEVLRAIVQDFIDTKEPVGSKSLLERHPFGVSSATIRNDMALLEEEELIVAPHTSSGRVPTDKGYRLFVDRLSEVKPLAAAERHAIESLLSGTADLDDILGRTVRLLAQLTNQVAMVQYPSLGRSKIHSVELIRLTENRILLILIADNGRVQQHIAVLANAVDEEFVANTRAKLATLLNGQDLSAVDSLVANFAASFAPIHAAEIDAILAALAEVVDANRQDKVLLAGTANLAKSERDFSGSILPVLEAIDEQVVLLKLLAEMEADQNGVALRIGRENELVNLSNASVLVSDYENQGAPVAKIGVIGPTRMDYQSHISAVRAVARYLTKTLGN